MSEEDNVKKKENKKEKRLPKVDLEKLKQSHLFKLMIDSNLITEQGFRITGMGLILAKLDEQNRLIDKTNLKLFYLEKKLDRR